MRKTGAPPAMSLSFTPLRKLFGVEIGGVGLRGRRLNNYPQWIQSLKIRNLPNTIHRVIPRRPALG
jgi:hypothetical protein